MRGDEGYWAVEIYRPSDGATMETLLVSADKCVAAWAAMTLDYFINNAPTTP